MGAVAEDTTRRVSDSFADMANNVLGSLRGLVNGIKSGDFMSILEGAFGVFQQLAGDGPYATQDDVPLSVLLPAFMTSELKTAFQIGFLIFLPFLVIDMVVASILMALGMMMLSPMLVALPIKLLLFVLVDGWALTVGSLAATYGVGG
jgi:flagellar biosynthetic protein FliP